MSLYSLIRDVLLFVLTVLGKLVLADLYGVTKRRLRRCWRRRRLCRWVRSRQLDGGSSPRALPPPLRTADKPVNDGQEHTSAADAS